MATWRLVCAMILLAPAMSVLVSCEPVATSFDETEEATYYQASSLVPVPDTFSAIRVMTWNIRYGAGRILWFGDACGDRVILEESEVLPNLERIAAKINLEKPDILLLQEVDINSKRTAYIDQLQWLLDHTYFNYAVCGSQWKAQFIPSDGIGRMDEENAILSRWPLSNAVRTQLALRNDQDKVTRYFYERCCMVTARINVPGKGKIYAVNAHTSSSATPDIKQQQINQFKSELDRIAQNGAYLVAGGDLNTLPPASAITDYCLSDKCEWESFHGTGDNPFHKEGSDYTPDKLFLHDLFTSYRCAVLTEQYKANPSRYFSYSQSPSLVWDRTLDYLFTNYQWVDSSLTTHQEATLESDHAPVSVLFKLPE